MNKNEKNFINELKSLLKKYDVSFELEEENHKLKSEEMVLSSLLV
jgi:hypothetical protein